MGSLEENEVDEEQEKVEMPHSDEHHPPDDEHADHPNEEFEAELKELPHIADYIKRLHRQIGKQRKKIKKLFEKLKDQRSISITLDTATQTDGWEETPDVNEEVKEGWDCDDLAKEVQQVAENALTQAGMVYEPTSGMYYDYKSGFYYNAELRMYYDGNSGRYLVYDETTKEYSYQTDTITETESKEKSSEQEKKGRKRKFYRDGDESSGDKEAGELSESSSEVEKDEEEEEEEEEDDEDDVEENMSWTNRGRMEVEKVDKPSSTEEKILESEASASWPPCLRLMVLSSSAPGIKVGQLFLVTCQGGDIGREGKPAILLPEQLVSKVHLKISYKDSSYQVVDVGSRNGTWLNDKRISAALQESELTAISHGDCLRIGSTKLGVHIHSGQDTCEQCEPGLQLKKEVIPAPLPATYSIRSLRKRFGLGQQNPMLAPSPDYKDRAETRRVKVGSSHHAEKTEAACVNQSIPAANKGFKMLEKMGWAKGESLGKNDQGIKEPVQLVSNEGSTGLGASSYGVGNVGKTASDVRKRRVLQVTQARFSKLPEQLPEVEDAAEDEA